MTAIDVEVQVGTAPLVDVDVQVSDPTFTVVSVLPTGPRGPAGPTGPAGANGAAGAAGPAGADGQDGADGVVQSIVAGDNVTVDDTDPANPIVSTTAASGAASALAAHAADTTNVHGIADTSALVLTGDARLSDARTPAAHATSHQDGGSDELALDGSQITSGTVADARIASTLARDSEVTAAVAAEAALARNADNLSGGTVADARIASTIARDSEVTSAVAAEAALARNADNLSSGTVADARIASTIARDSEVTNAVAAEVIARDAAIAAAISALIAGAPGALDTLDELAAAFGDDANFAATMTTALSGKQPIDSGLTAIAALTTTSFGRAFLALANAAAGISALGLDADLATLSLPGSTTISSFGASLVDDADASAARSTLGLGTAATQASGAFDAAGAAAAAQAASQPLDSDLTAVAALTPSNDDVIQRKAGAWTNRTVEQVKTDFGIQNLQTQAAIAAAREEVRRISDLGYFVNSGLALAVSGTAGKLDMAAGVAFQATTEKNAAAQTAISTTITTLASALTAGQAVWVVVELDSSNVVNFNAGSAAAAASAAFPTITSTRVPLGFLYVPYGATLVDVSLTGASNGNAKLIDCRNERRLHVPRILAEDYSITTTTAPATITGIVSIIASSTLNKTAHGFILDDRVIFGGISTTTGITNGTSYWVVSTGLTANAFRVSATQGGAAITFGGTADAAITANKVTLQSLLAATFTIPADSLSVGDKIEIEVGFVSTNNIAASAIQAQALLNAGAIAAYTSGSLSTSAFTRPHTMRGILVVKSIGAGGAYTSLSRGSFGNIITNTAEFEADSSVFTNVALDTTAAITVDVKARFVAASPGASFTLGPVTVTKIPGP